ncbi:hypothetical protein PMAYCL1PPCAC_00162, partial [Pristionchus mayeri]
KIQAIDDERIRDTKAALEMAINAEKEVSVIINRCHDDMKRALEVIDPPRDTSALVEQFRTGYAHPPLARFEDVGRPEDVLCGGDDSVDGNGATLKRGILGGGGNTAKKEGKGVSRKQSMHSKIFGGGSSASVEVKKNPDGTSDYSSLPRQQRVRRLQAKLAEMENEREKKIQSKEGVVKMQLVYRENPKLGNPADCEQQIQTFAKEIDTLTSLMKKLRVQLDDAIAHTAPPIGYEFSSTTPSRTLPRPSVVTRRLRPRVLRAAPPHNTRVPRLLLLVEGLPLPLHHVRSHPQTTEHSTEWARPATVLWRTTSHRTSYSEESVSSEGSRMTNNNGRDEVYDEMTMPALGTCTALFDFEGGTTEGTVMKEGQEFVLVERDEGDGWTRVRSVDGRNEGFVPSSYLRCKWYPSDQKWLKPARCRFFPICNVPIML